MFNFSETTVHFFTVFMRSAKRTWEAHKNKSKQWTMRTRRNNSYHRICDNGHNIITCMSGSHNSLRCRKRQCRQHLGILLCTWLENVNLRPRTVIIYTYIHTYIDGRTRWLLWNFAWQLDCKRTKTFTSSGVLLLAYCPYFEKEM
jgi:hypothetical protein